MEFLPFAWPQASPARFSQPFHSPSHRQPTGGLDMGRVSAMIGGEAGFGIMSSGELLAKCLTHGGLWVYTNIEYPSLIRGGHNATHVTASEEPIVGYYPELQVLIAPNKQR